jgi:hypothetical protein
MKFLESGNILNQKRNGQAYTTKRILKSIQVAARGLQLCCTTVHGVFPSGQQLCPYKVQILQITDHAKWQMFEQQWEVLCEVLCTDEATFLMFGKVNRFNMRTWGPKNLLHVIEHI